MIWCHSFVHGTMGIERSIVSGDNVRRTFQRFGIAMNNEHEGNLIFSPNCNRINSFQLIFVSIQIVTVDCRYQGWYTYGRTFAPYRGKLPLKCSILNRSQNEIEISKSNC